MWEHFKSKARFYLMGIIYAVFTLYLCSFYIVSKCILSLEILGYIYCYKPMGKKYKTGLHETSLVFIKFCVSSGSKVLSL